MRTAQVVRDAISFFTSSLIAGDIGPDDSSQSKSDEERTLKLFRRILQRDPAAPEVTRIVALWSSRNVCLKRPDESRRSQIHGHWLRSR